MVVVSEYFGRLNIGYRMSQVFHIFMLIADVFEFTSIISF